MILRALVLLLLALPACAPLPQVTRVLGKTGPTPALLPLEALPLADAGASAATAPDLTAQAAALRARAAALRAR